MIREKIWLTFIVRYARLTSVLPINTFMHVWLSPLPPARLTCGWMQMLFYWIRSIDARKRNKKYERTMANIAPYPNQSIEIDRRCWFSIFFLALLSVFWVHLLSPPIRCGTWNILYSTNVSTELLLVVDMCSGVLRSMVEVVAVTIVSVISFNARTTHRLIHYKYERGNDDIFTRSVKCTLYSRTPCRYMVHANYISWADEQGK